MLHLGVGTEGHLATLPNAMSLHGVFGPTSPNALAAVDRICRAVREWKVHFEDAGVPGIDIDCVATAFRKPRDVGADTLTARS
jgi:serine/threonine-protein kinase HipA